MKLHKTTWALCMAVASVLAIPDVSYTQSHAETELNIATVNNGHLVELRKLTNLLEKANSSININRGTLEL